MERLVRLADDKVLREELTAFPLAMTSEDAIKLQHRPGYALALMEHTMLFGNH